MDYNKNKVKSVKVKFNKYEMVPRKKLTDNTSEKWISNGLKNNSQFQKYDELYYGSTTHKSVIDKYVDFILGEELVDINRYDISDILSVDDLSLFVKDFKKSGQGALHVRYSASGEIIKLKHIPIRRLKINAEKDVLIDPTGYWFCYDWNDESKWGSTYIPAFGKGEKGDTGLPLSNEIFYLRQVDDMESYSIPDWEPGIQYCEDELEISNFIKTHIMKKLSVQTIINLNVGDGMSQQQIEEYVESFVEQFTGSGGDTYAITVNKAAELAPTITSIALEFKTDEFQFLMDAAKMNILQAHGVNNPTLFNVIAPSGFSSQADDKIMSEQSLKDTIIRNYRRTILNGLNKLFRVNSENIDLIFLDKGQDIDNPNRIVTNLDIESDKQLAVAQAALRGSAAGIGAVIQIQQSVSNGVTSIESAVAMLEIIYGYSKEDATRLLGSPTIGGQVTPVENTMYDIKK